MRRLRRGRGWRRRSRAKARRVRLRLRAGGVRRPARPRVFSSRRALRVQRRAGRVGGKPSGSWVPCSSLTSVTCPLARERCPWAATAQRREGVRREMYGYSAAASSGGGGFEVRRRGPGAGLEVRPEGGAAGVLSLHVCGLHHGRRGGGQTAASGPADDAAVSGVSSRPSVGARVAPGDRRARPGRRLANPRRDDDDRLRYPPTTATYEYPPTPPTPPSSQPPSQHPPLRLCATWTISGRPHVRAPSRPCLSVRPRRVAKTWQTSWGSRRTRT